MAGRRASDVRKQRASGEQPAATMRTLGLGPPALLRWSAAGIGKQTTRRRVLVSSRRRRHCARRDNLRPDSARRCAGEARLKLDVQPPRCAQPQPSRTRHEKLRIYTCSTKPMCVHTRDVLYGDDSRPASSGGVVWRPSHVCRRQGDISGRLRDAAEQKCFNNSASAAADAVSLLSSQLICLH